MALNQEHYDFSALVVPADTKKTEDVQPDVGELQNSKSGSSINDHVFMTSKLLSSESTSLAHKVSSTFSASSSCITLQQSSEIRASSIPSACRL